MGGMFRCTQTQLPHNINVNTHILTFFKNLLHPYIHSWADRHSKLPKRTNFGPKSGEHAQTDIVECMLVGLSSKTLSYGLCCFIYMIFFLMIPKPQHLASFFCTWKLEGVGDWWAGRLPQVKTQTAIQNKQLLRSVSPYSPFLWKTC